jgi:hypothetical protein
MEKRYYLALVFLFSVHHIHAQPTKNQLPGQPSQMKEIRADQHLERELQKKQLSAKPEQLAMPADSTVKAKTFEKPKSGCRPKNKNAIKKG